MGGELEQVQEEVQSYSAMDDDQFMQALTFAKEKGNSKKFSFDERRERVTVRGRFRDEEHNERKKKKYVEALSEEEQTEIKNAGGKLIGRGKRKAKRAEIRARHEESYGEYVQEQQQKRTRVMDDAYAELLGQLGRLKTLSGECDAALTDRGSDKEKVHAALERAQATLENIILAAREPLSIEDDRREEMMEKLLNLERLYSMLVEHSTEAADSMAGANQSLNEEIDAFTKAYKVSVNRLEGVTMSILEKKEENCTWGHVIQRAQGQKVKVLNQVSKAGGGSLSDIVVDKKKRDKETIRKFVKRRDFAGSPEFKLRMHLKASMEDPTVMDKVPRTVLTNIVAYLTSDDPKQHAKAKELAQSQSLPDILFDGNNFTQFFWENLSRAMNHYGNLNAMYRDELGYTVGNSRTVTDLDISAHNIASTRMARMFGVGDSYVRAEDATIKSKDGTGSYQGIVMKDTKGIGFYQLRDKLRSEGVKITDVEFSPKAQKQLIDIQFMDNITGQSDRHINNIHCTEYVIDEQKVIHINSIICIDNDLAFGKNFEFSEMEHKNTSSVLRRIKGKRGYELAIHSIDKGLFDKIKSMRFKDIELALSTVLDKDRIDATLARFSLIKLSLMGHKAFSRDERERIVDLMQKYYPETVSVDPETGKPELFFAKATSEELSVNTEEDWKDKKKQEWVYGKDQGHGRDFQNNIKFIRAVLMSLAKK